MRLFDRYLFVLTGVFMSMIQLLSLLADPLETSGTSESEVILQSTDALGGSLGPADSNRSAVFFSATAPVSDKIRWTLNIPLPQGLWKVDLNLHQTKAPISPDQRLIFEDQGGVVVADFNLYFIGFEGGSYTKSLGFYCDRPVKYLTLVKSGQRNLDTVGVTSIKINSTSISSLNHLPSVFKFSVKEHKIIIPFALPVGVWIVTAEKPVSINWDGVSFVTPPSCEARVYLDQTVTPVVVGGDSLKSVQLTHYAESPSSVITERKTAPLIQAYDPNKTETKELSVIGDFGDVSPRFDLFPNGKTMAIVTGWDDGPLMDLQLLDCLNQYGIKGTFFLNRRSPMVDHLKDIEINGMEIGSHSWSHPPLYLCSPQRCADEVVEMRRFLEGKLGHPVISFAYPYGYEPAYDKTGDYVLGAIRKAGYWSARITSPGESRIDAITEPLLMHPVFHFKTGAAKVTAEFNDLRKQPGSIMYLWGHSYELKGEDWAVWKSVLEPLAHQPDVWYATQGDLMVWRFLRDQSRIERSVQTKEGTTYYVKVPSLHPCLRNIPLSIILPENVKSVVWDGKTILVENHRVQLF